MLNADSRALKSDSELQSEEDAADDPEGGRVALDGAHGGHDVVDRAGREQPLELGDEVARLVDAVRQTEQGECEKRERDERDKRKVGDHRGEMRATVGEELGKRSERGLPENPRQEDPRRRRGRSIRRTQAVSSAPWTRARRWTS